MLSLQRLSGRVCFVYHLQAALSKRLNLQRNSDIFDAIHAVSLVVPLYVLHSSCYSYCVYRAHVCACVCVCRSDSQCPVSFARTRVLPFATSNSRR